MIQKLKAKVKELNLTLEQTQQESQAQAQEAQNKIDLLQKAFDELKEQYNILATKDLQDMRRQPSNLVSSYSLHKSQ